MNRIELSPADLAQIDLLVRQVTETFAGTADPGFVHEACTYAQELPRRLRSSMNELRLKEAGAWIVSGFHVDDDRIGPTPRHWRDGKRCTSTAREEVFFYLCSCLLGDPVGWATEQDGFIMHDVLPIEGHEKDQLGSGSEAPLTWHTEDAFHPLRTDWIALMCLRNPDGVQTTYASIEDLELDEELMRTLAQPEFLIRPDRSHLPNDESLARPLSAAERELLQRSYAWTTKLAADPEAIGVLFGPPEAPYLRLDPAYMNPPADESIRTALATIVAEIDRRLNGYVLRPGEIIFLDNYRTVHGRHAFKARFDGTDRWLKRLIIVRDLRKSRTARVSADSRIIY